MDEKFPRLFACSFVDGSFELHDCDLPPAEEYMTVREHQAEIAQLLEALHYYSDPRVWCSMGHGAYADIGKIARNALDQAHRARHQNNIEQEGGK